MRSGAIAVIRADAATVVALIGAGYVLGVIPSAVWVARSRGVDIYSVGSGNPGASNVYRTLGKGPAAAVFALDAGKGIAAAALGYWFVGGGAAFALLGGIAAVAGHTWPASRAFKGGRGVATAAGAILVAYPVVFAVLLGAWGLGVALSRKPSVGALVAVPAFLVAVVVARRPLPETVLAIVLAGMVAVRHSANIGRLVRGEEHGLSEPLDKGGRIGAE